MSIAPLTAAPPARHQPPRLDTALAERYRRIRAQSLHLAAPLSEADCQVQSMPDASPVKWHLAHVTWFFETLVLERFEPGFVAHDPAFRVLFNSYYNGIGQQHTRAQRGLITRPDMAAVRAYRAAVDERVLKLLRAPPADAITLIELGLQHEQQHQELMLTDLLHLLSMNPTAPAYLPRWPLTAVAPLGLDWIGHQGGLVEIGHDNGAEGSGFAFDNETPRHRHFLAPYALANRLVTNGEWQAFIDDGAYRAPRWWLAAGWDWVCAQQIEAPLYWRRDGDGWSCFTLHGQVPVDANTPVTHISLFEADAFARWSAAQTGLPLRLPTEAEWEHAAAPLLGAQLAAGNFVESGALHPVPVAQRTPGLMQMFGDVWEWTRSAYLPYPGFKPWDGAVGEYNGKFMCDQTVLRGGSCVTPRSHLRATYRNFFPATTRWQFNGLRLAKEIA